MNKSVLALAMLLAIGSSLFAQRNCGSMEYLEMQIQEDSKRMEKMERIENHTKHFMQHPDQRVVDGVITIPVVVHVIYNTSSENISDAQVQSQIDILNEDFRRLNSDADGTWSQAQDSEIEFCLATVDPAGNATNGITRTSTSNSSFGTNDQMKFTSSGGRDAWPSSQYMNFWVCDISGGILGYAQFPGGSASTDGVVCDYQYVGNIGTASAPFDLGRTATHEVGHWLNLRHIWGDGGCSVDDFVSDTPTSDGANYGCATGHSSCSSTDMVQNYMDYSDDACMNLFTAGQNVRMRALFDNGGFRSDMLNSSACGTPPPPSTCTDGIQNGQETGVDCGGPTCDPCPCFGSFVNVTINLDNYPEETTWSITSGSTTFASGGTYGNQPDGSTISFDICLDDGCYDFNIYDSYGDGICCGYGEGSYVVSNDSGTLASGGSFASSETTNFCLNSGPAPTCNDGIQNQGETGVDCGGPCTPCETCDDGIQNQGETGVDCGGPCSPCETCDDGIQNQGETGVDCGGPCSACATCDDGIQNQGETGVDCGGPCTACETCDDGIQNQGETGVDCGGPCSACATCDDGIQNQGETGVDCGGPCSPCETCDDGVQNGDETGVDCGGACVACPTCDDGIQNGGEKGIDCGGPCPDCETCDDGIQNQGETGVDCGGPCTACATCDDGIQNGDETGVDCGGACLACPTCDDGIQNGSETGVDCGGPCTACATCDDGIQNGDETGVDCGGDCVACPTCDDGVQNGSETGVDCGGPCAECETCDDGIQNQGETGVDCGGPCADCETCNDGIQNQGETGVDCGGPCSACATCDDGIQNQGETGVDCGGPCADCETCDDGIQNQGESGVDCGGPCAACETCDDGIQNQGETGVDCGGPCSPCGGGGCTYVTIDSHDFEANWGLWNDGGSDCRRSARDAAYASSGQRCVRLRDNTSTSVTRTDNMDLRNYDEVTIDFIFYPRSMENNEDFWVQLSTNAGTDFTTIESFVAGVDFSNNSFYSASVVISGSFGRYTQLRFRNDASGNSDWIYIDDVVISGCVNGTFTAPEEGEGGTIEQQSRVDISLASEMELNLFPNPATNELNISFEGDLKTRAELQVMDMNGRVVLLQGINIKEGSNKITLDVDPLESGSYIILLSSDGIVGTKRFVVAR